MAKGAPVVSKVNYSISLLDRNDRDRAGVRASLDALRRSRGWHNCRVLEVGCGTGGNLRLFAEDCDVSGLDGLPEAVAAAQAHGLAVSCADLDQPLDLPADHYDVVLCLDVLEHLVRPVELLRTLRGTMKPDGSLLILIPNHLNLRGRLRLLRGRNLDVHGYFPEHDEWDNPHLRFFTHAGASRMLAAAGLHMEGDFSHEFPCLPRIPPFRDVSESAIGRRLARWRPSLFAAGFFLLAHRGPPSACAGPTRQD